MGNQYLDCPHCGDDVDIMKWERPSERWPDGCWVGRDGDMATCVMCGWRVMVSCDGEELPYLVEVACPHGHAPDDGCRLCELIEWLDTAAYWLRRWCREWWCGLLRRHQWVPLQGAGSYCRRCGKSRLP